MDHSTDIITLFHPTRNFPLLPDDLNPKSNSKLWWLGACGHEWDAAPRNIMNGQRCPYCSGRRVLAGFNDLTTTHPELAKEWHSTSNSILPTQVSAGSQKKIWWTGNCGHSWEAAISQRAGNRKSGCVFCAGQKVLIGFNDLHSFYPELSKEWDFQKNAPLTPHDVTTASGKKVWWVGTCGHQWIAAISHRSKRGSGCDKCARTKSGTIKKIPLSGRSVAEAYPDLAAQWHPTLNEENTPYRISAGSNTVVAWSCPKGHVWNTPVYQRTGITASGCPQCSLSKSVSESELELSTFLTSLGVKVETSNRTVLSGLEIDIYLPEYNLGIEYNGLYWHTEEMGKDKKYHYNKWLMAHQKSVQLLHVWEDDWRDRRNIIMSMIAHKIKATGTLATVYPEFRERTDRIFARKTRVAIIDMSMAKNFLEKYHIQGYASGFCYLGLIDDSDILRSVLVLRQERAGSFLLSRYATNGIVIGGFTKLLSHVVNTYNTQEIITFADHAVSDGSLYRQSGFVVDSQLDPDYSYLVDKKRHHKFNYRLKRFREDANLRYEDGLSERELAQLNGIKRIWDAGKTRYKYIPRLQDREIHIQSGD